MYRVSPFLCAQHAERCIALIARITTVYLTVPGFLQASARAHTPTSFAPFCLHTEMRLPQRNRKTTDEIRVAEAKKAKDAEVLRRRQQLQRLQKQERARTESPQAFSEASSAPARARNVKPFQLASVMRHEREVQNRKQQMQVRLPTASAEQSVFVVNVVLPNEDDTFSALPPFGGFDQLLCASTCELRIDHRMHLWSSMCCSFQELTLSA